VKKRRKWGEEDRQSGQDNERIDLKGEVHTLKDRNRDSFFTGAEKMVWSLKKVTRKNHTERKKQKRGVET